MAAMDGVLRLIKPVFLPVQAWFDRLRRGVTFGVRAVVSDGERILLIRHSYLPGWYLPGGGVDPGEAAVDAMVRELAEETGLQPVDPPRLVGLYFNRRKAARDHVALYRIERWREIRAFVPNSEIREARFFPLSDLPPDVTDATRRRIEEVFFNAVPASDW